MRNFIQEKKYFFVTLIVFIAFTIITGEKDTEQEIIIKDEIKEEVDGKSEEKNILYIHVAGNVGNPGLFQLEEGSRVNDLIMPAKINDLEILDKYFNRAEILVDGQKVYIPFPNELEKFSLQEENTYGENNSKKININTAKLSKLIELPGIGESKGKDIIEFREKNGNFKIIDDIMNVKGIGIATFEKMKELIKT